jgi:hypothetical protein
MIMLQIPTEFTFDASKWTTDWIQGNNADALSQFILSFVPKDKVATEPVKGTPFSRLSFPGLTREEKDIIKKYKNENYDFYQQVVDANDEGDIPGIVRAFSKMGIKVAVINWDGNRLKKQSLSIGDTVTRLLGGSLPMKLNITDIKDGLIH